MTVYRKDAGIHTDGDSLIFLCCSRAASWCLWDSRSQILYCVTQEWVSGDISTCLQKQTWNRQWQPVAPVNNSIEALCRARLQSLCGEASIATSGENQGWVRKLLAINHSKPRWRSLSLCPPDHTTSLVVIRGGFGSWGRLRTVTLKMKSRGKLLHFPTRWSQGAVKPWGHAWKGMVVPWAHTRPGWRGSRGAGGSVRQRWCGWAAGCAPCQPQLNPSLAKDARDPRRRTSKVVGNFSLK